MPYLKIFDFEDGIDHDSIARPLMTFLSCQDTETTRPSVIVWFQL